MRSALRGSWNTSRSPSSGDAILHLVIACHLSRLRMVRRISNPFLNPCDGQGRWTLHRRSVTCLQCAPHRTACGLVTRPDGIRAVLCRSQPIRSAPIVFQDHQRLRRLRLPIDRSTGQEIGQLIPVSSFEQGPIRIGRAGVSRNRSGDWPLGESCFLHCRAMLMNAVCPRLLWTVRTWHQA